MGARRPRAGRESEGGSWPAPAARSPSDGRQADTMPPAPFSFEPYVRRWNLVPDGAPIATHGSRLLPVRRDGAPAMLKVALEAEEAWGASLMAWWAGNGAARVLAHEGDALLLERAPDPGKLTRIATSGRDEEASRILCGVAARLHAPRITAPPALVPLERWFAALEPAAERHGGLLLRAAAAARELLAAPREVVTLHGDLHHGNVLDFGARGWLAIDPKRLAGERGFDYANIFCNPTDALALRPGRLERQSHVVAEAAGLDRRRLLGWILAYAGLSAAWSLADAERAVDAGDGEPAVQDGDAERAAKAGDGERAAYPNAGEHPAAVDDRERAARALRVAERAVAELARS